MSRESPTTPDPDRYLAIASGPEVETRVRGSRFIARALAVRSEAEARAELQRVRKRYHDATHHCWALRIGTPEAALERCDDDGEPSGTGGAPILGALHRAGVSDALVVVTRYFGGVKLGTGGLGRAYAEAARAALDAAGRTERFLTVPLEVRCRFEQVGAVETLIARAGSRVVAVGRSFDPAPCFRLRVKRSAARSLRRELVDATGGTARIEGGEEEP